MSENKKEGFGSKIGFIFAAAGSAVGLGNIWRFPYLAAKYGGGIFLLVYIILAVTFGFSLMITEIAIGRKTGKSVIGAYKDVDKRFSFLSPIAAAVPFIITPYYCVIGGWVLKYLCVFCTGAGKSVADEGDFFTGFIGHWYEPALFFAVFVIITALVVILGVQKGIELMSKILMPVLFVLLIIMAICSVMLPGSGPGLEFLLKPDFNKVNSGVLLSAMGQTFYSLSLGMGCLCTYASYFQSDTNLTKTAFNVATIDSLVAILAGLIIFPAAFSVGIQPDAGPSLVFITLPNVLTQAFAGLPWLTYILSTAFYLLLALAALTSTISMHEVVTVYLHEEFKMSRRKAAWLVTSVCGIIGVFCALSMGVGKEYTLFGMNLFDIFDFVTAKLMLPLGGFFISIFTGWYLDKKILRDELNSGGHLPLYVYKAIVFILRVVAPIGIGFVFINELGIL